MSTINSQLSHISEHLALWYEHNGRDLPWRAAPDAYRVWLSEVILQQTTVKQGTDYYLRFLERFPTVEALAAASEDEVLRLWQGLGYYTRARNLYKASRQVVERGGFPTDFKGLRTLAGVGDYTAAAIASIAFGEPCAVVDGNVYRVLARHFGIDTPIDTPAGKRTFAALAHEVLDKRHPARHNQAMMDFGATLCTPRAPRCPDCPVAASCLALAEGRVEDLPVKARRIKPTEVRMDYVLVHTPMGLYLRQRGKKGIWAGLWEIPETLTSRTPSRIPSLFPSLSPSKLPSELCHPSPVREGEDTPADGNAPASFKGISPSLQGEGWRSSVGGSDGEGLIGTFTHHLTHRTILCRATAVAVEEGTEIPGYTFVRWDDLDRYALPRLVENIIQTFRSNLSISK